MLVPAQNYQSHGLETFYLGNWCAAAGLFGGRINRFNITKQSNDYDKEVPPLIFTMIFRFLRIDNYAARQEYYLAYF